MGSLKYKGTTAEELTRWLYSKGDHVVAAGRAELIAQTSQTAEIAKEQAPVDTGNLEEGIKVKRRQIGPWKTSMTIQVSAVAEDGFDYATVQHEGVEGVNWHPGPGTLLKRAGSTRYVGPKFLQRAFEDRKEEIETAILNAALKAFYSELN